MAGRGGEGRGDGALEREGGRRQATATHRHEAGMTFCSAAHAALHIVGGQAHLDVPVGHGRGQGVQVGHRTARGQEHVPHGSLGEVGAPPVALRHHIKQIAAWARHMREVRGGHRRSSRRAVDGSAPTTRDGGKHGVRERERERGREREREGERGREREREGERERERGREREGEREREREREAEGCVGDGRTWAVLH